MQKLLLSILLSVFSLSALAQGRVTVWQKGGGTLTFPLSQVKTVTFAEPAPPPSEKVDKVVNGHGFIDLGLPSGLLWATRNVGADSPEASGDYFAWGETTPKSAYTWETYQWCDGAGDKLTKYCLGSNNGLDGFSDNKSVLEPADDAATANWGAPCRMPTMAEFTELYDNCKWEWTTYEEDGDVYGCKFTSKANGKSVFFPAAGLRSKETLFYKGTQGEYWSASLLLDYLNGSANDLNFAWNFVSAVANTGINRCAGFPVRPVTK